MEKKEVFKHVFHDIPFPHFAIDLWALVNFIKEFPTPHSHIAIPYLSNNPKNDAFCGALTGIFKRIEPPIALFPLIADSAIFKSINPSGIDIREFIESHPNHWYVFEKDGKIVWEEGSYWPVLYSTLIQQVYQLIQLFQKASSAKLAELKDNQVTEIRVVAEYPRNLPTAYHYAAASLGEWVGGAANVQYFTYYATAPQIGDLSKNIEYAKKIEYTKEDADELSQSGMICIPATLLMPLAEAQGAFDIFGSISIDEVNAINFPSKAFFDRPSPDNIKHPGFILDKYYRAPFFARPLQDYAIYGAASVLRDHYTDFYKSLHNPELMRCKHYSFPIIEVEGTQDIIDLIAKIPKRDKNGLFFRGQTKLYPINRTERVKKMLFGDSVSLEPSLITSACRLNYDYDNLHFAIRYFIQNWLFTQKRNSSDLVEVMEKWREMSVSPLCGLDFAIMALAQHYGLPSHGLDVTTSPDVAIWFATHKFSQENRFASYSLLATDDWQAEKANWPMIFVFQTVLNSHKGSLIQCHELEDFGIRALRPNRQSALFYHGGHSDHQNRLAESMVCAFRLKPGFYPTQVDFDYLFPRPEEDPAYALMVELANTEPFSFLAKDKVTLFHK